MAGLERQRLAVAALARTQPISQLASANQVSRKFVYSQADKAEIALEECFQPTPQTEKVLFYLPVTKTWLMQFVLAKTKDFVVKKHVLFILCHDIFNHLILEKAVRG